MMMAIVMMMMMMLITNLILNSLFLSELDSLTFITCYLSLYHDDLKLRYDDMMI